MALRISSLARRLEKKKINLYNFRHTVVALAILEQKDNPRSFWKPYIDIFPDNFNEFPLKYTDKEFNLLQNSSYSEEIKYQQE